MLSAAVLLLPLAPTRAIDTELTELRGRVEKLEKQNEQLLRALGNGQLPAPAAASDDNEQKPKALPSLGTGPEGEADPGEQTKPAEEKDRAIGENLGVKGRWIKGDPKGSASSSLLWFETEDKAFRFHVGGRFQVDGVWVQAPERVQFGKGGIGQFDDAVNFRRLRLTAEGWIYEVFDFDCEVDFVQTVNDDPTLPPNPATNVINLPSLTDMWASINYIPCLGTVRIGNQKPPILLEHLTSSRFLDFLERSPLFDVNYHRNGGFQPGIQIMNWTENERMTWQLGLFKNSEVLVPYIVGGGDYQVNGRLTVLPWYQECGRYMIHLGLGVQYDEPHESVGAFFRERFLLRNGPPTTHTTVALAILNGHHQIWGVPEFFMNLGPFSFQAEYLANYLDSITMFQTQPQGTVMVKGAPKSFFSQGAYVELMYFLTGENRPYGRTPLHSNGAAPTRVVPFRNFHWVPGSGCNPLSVGAWQVGVRYSYFDLSNNGIYGGQVNEVTFGVNWYLNPNMKIQWNYDIGYRGQLGPGSDSNGTYQGFGTRFACDF